MVSEIRECSINDFLSGYAPFIPSTGSIKNAFQTLKFNQRLPEEVDNAEKKVRPTQDQSMQNFAESGATEGTDYRTGLQGIIESLSTIECNEQGVDEPRLCEFSSRDCQSEMGRLKTKF